MTPVATAIEPTWESFRRTARDLLIRGVAPEAVAWSETASSGTQLSLMPEAPVDAADLAATATDAARDRCESKGVRLDVHLAPVGRVNVDPDRIGQVLGNLIDNALRHTPAGGSVTLSCRRVEHWVEYAVADTGEGIAAESIPRVTERFFRIDQGRSREGGGIGLGLAIVKHVLSRHDGTLKIESQPGKGSRFVCRFPPERLVKAAPVPLSPDRHSA